MEPLSAGELRAALGEVAGRLQRRGRRARIYVVGGAAMALAYEADRLTRDIDAAIVEGHGPLLEEVRAVARERAWPTTWLNEQATAYMPPAPLARGRHCRHRPVAERRDRPDPLTGRGSRSAAPGPLEWPAASRRGIRGLRRQRRADPLTPRGRSSQVAAGGRSASASSVWSRVVT